MVRMEWLILELLVLAWAIYELVSVRRSMRRDRVAKESAGPAAPSIEAAQADDPALARQVVAGPAAPRE